MDKKIYKTEIVETMRYIEEISARLGQSITSSDYYI